MRKGPVVLKPLASRKSQVSNILGVRRQENSPAFEVRDQAALNWQSNLVERRAPSWPTCPYQAKPGIASVLQAARDYRRGKKALWLHALGAAELPGIAREACDITRVAPAIRSPAPPAQPLLPGSQRAVSASVGAARRRRYSRRRDDRRASSRRGDRRKPRRTEWQPRSRSASTKSAGR